MKKFIIFLFCIFLLSQFLSADVIQPGYKSIKIINQIDNINDYPEYTFVTGPLQKDFVLGSSMCPFQLVTKDGTISSHYYKHCTLSVYAIPNDKWEEEYLNYVNNKSISSEEEIKRIESFLILTDAQEIISGLKVEMLVPVNSPTNEKINHYTITNLNANQVELSETNIINNYNKIIICSFISLIALITIITIIVRRKKQKK